MKGITFLANALKDLKAFPKEAMREAGYQLDRIQHGYEPNAGNQCTQLEKGCVKFVFMKRVSLE